MPIVSIVKFVPQVPDRATAKQQIRIAMNDLFDVWIQHYGDFLAGKTFYLLGYEPGDYSRAKAGVVVPPNPFETSGGGAVLYAYAVSDDPEDEKSPHCLWKLNPDPDFWPGEGKNYEKGGGPMFGSGQI